jgi:hypothetical protein
LDACLALVMRIAFGWRSVYETTRRRLRSERPILKNRYPLRELPGSDIVSSKGSEKTVLASPNDTPCLRTFNSALLVSHSKSITFPIRSVSG